MRRSQLSEQELRLQAERLVTYRGTARIRLENLYFEPDESRELSRKNVERLKERFRKDILRLVPRHHIPAVVDQADLDDGIQASKISAGALLSNLHDQPPMLQFPTRLRLTCLHGRHRIQAARETLSPNDAWWTVDLYLTGMSILSQARGQHLSNRSRRHQPGTQDDSSRRVFVRTETIRWRDLLQSTTI